MGAGGAEPRGHGGVRKGDRGCRPLSGPGRVPQERDPIGLGVLQTFRGTDGVPCRWGAEAIQTNGGLGALVRAKALQAEPLRGQPW